MRNKIALLLSAMLLGGQALAAQPDLTNTAAFDNTCASVLAREPATVRERQAYVICADVALVQQAWTFFKQLAENYRERQLTPEEMIKAVTAQLTSIRAQLRKSRVVLENTELRSFEDGLLIAPATWVRDLDGDGTVSTSERYFFAIPARGDGALATGMPSEDEAYYAKEYDLKATIRLDQTDIYWALAYHNFIESLAEAVLSYDYRRDAEPLRQIRLIDAAGMLRAHELFTTGLRMSDKMRMAALRETDDDLEWLPNPRQVNTAFPVPLDAADFRIWEDLLKHLVPLVEGKTLLPISPEVARNINAPSLVCPAGRGLDIAALWREAPKYPLEFLQHGKMDHYCRKIDVKRPASGLQAFAEAFSSKMDDAERVLRFMRRWLWVN